MRFEEIYDRVGQYALMSKHKARALYRFVIQERPVNIIELGCYQGGSALVMAAALDELGHGVIRTFDFPQIRQLKPNVEQLLRDTELSRYVSVEYCDWCFEWEFAKILAANIRRTGYKPCFDFAYLDGGHYWTVTGYAFYLVNNLLRPGAWVLLDDLDWVIETHEKKGARYKTAICKYAQNRPMVQMVFDLIVRTHPDYANFRVTANGTWGWAQKRGPRHTVQAHLQLAAE
jgi:predicted O-methyltransferase YrrM